MELKPGQVDIRGKVYDTVALRVQKFRAEHPEWTLQTEIVERTEEVVVLKASILNELGRLLATGHSEEYRKASQINKTSALENAETSAIGRALASLGFAGTEFATADEVANAISKQKVSAKKVTDDVWDSLETDVQTWLADIAQCVKNELSAKGPEAAIKVLEDEHLSADNKVAIWSRFDSKERSALKGVKKPQETVNG